ncbi:WecB/TagA/CpsF family glycosyltransferase [Candidatus Gracilibacteria bacterium]|nr:WecB/TagA/CpsF family glycosyltransferase [Candidatus Gracilibacteria bacterium]
MKIFGVELQKLNYKNFLNEILNNSEQSIIFTPNPEILLAIKKDSEFTEILKKANYLTSDGIGLYIAFQILDNNFKYLNILFLPYFVFNILFRKNYLYKKYGDKICGSDLTLDLLDYSDKNKLGVTIIDKFQLPGNKGDNLKIVRQMKTPEILSKKYPKANFHFYFYQKENKEEIIEQINKTNDIYFFSTQGLKDQESTILELMPKLKNIKVALGVGGSFDMLLGFKKRAPKIFTSFGLEWLWRLIINPSRMLKRVYNAIFVFIYEVILSK